MIRNVGAKSFKTVVRRQRFACLPDLPRSAEYKKFDDAYPVKRSFKITRNSGS
jgi:hypothetical protein